MSDLKVINEVPLTMAELKDKLEDIKKRDKELSERAIKTQEYLNKTKQLLLYINIILNPSWNNYTI